MKDNDVEAEVKKRIEKISGTDFDAYIWPKTNSDIPDNKKLKFIVLAPQMTVNDSGTKRFMQDTINKYSTGFRTYKNTLMFLVTDQNEYDGCKRTTCRFLALDSIKTEKETLKRLTEEDRQRVEQKLKDTDSSLSIKLLSTYRYLAKASKSGIQTYDLGIPTLGDRQTLTKRTRNYLKDQEILLDKISPKALLEKTLSTEDDRKTVIEIWEAFLKYPELPILENEDVVKDAIVQGVQSGTFGLEFDNETRFCERISAMEIPDDGQLVRKEIAQKSKGETEKPQPAIEVVVHPGTPGTKTLPREETIRKMTLRASVPWDKLSELVRGVFVPLSQEGAHIALEIKIVAESDQGIRKGTLDLKIKETLNQIKANILEECEE